MSGDGKRSVAEWPKLPRPSSTLPTATSAAPLGIPLAAPERTWSGDNRRTGLDPLRTSGVSATAAYPLADRREWIFLQSLHAVCSAETPLILWRARHTRRQ